MIGSHAAVKIQDGLGNARPCRIPPILNKLEYGGVIAAFFKGSSGF
jgi:hypothetical protein